MGAGASAPPHIGGKPGQAGQPARSDTTDVTGFIPVTAPSPQPAEPRRAVVKNINKEAYAC